MPKKIVSEPFDIQTLHDDITSMGDGDGDGDGVEVDEGTDVVLSLDSSSTKRISHKTNGRGTSKECVNRSSDDAGKELVLEAGDISEADTAKGEEAKPKALISNNSDDPPYHLILHQQKRKYQTFIERLNSDNKRKQKEIESLRSELELIRDVLAVSGLDIDLVELKALVMARPSGGARVNPAEALASRAKKLILPPIGAIKLGHDGEDVGTIQDMEEAAKIVSTIVLDRKPAPLSDLLQHRKGAGAYSSATNALEAVSRSLALGGTVNEAGPSSIEPMHFVRSPHPSNSLDSSSVDGLASPIPPTTKTTKSIRAPTKTKPTSDSDNISAKLRSHRYRHRVTRADQPGDEAGGGHTLDDPTVAYTTNGNLDYQGRARTLKLIAMSNGAPDEDVASGKTLLPPLPSMGTADPAGVLPQVGKKAMKSKIGSVGGVTSNGNVTASTAWSKRVLGAKAVRQRQWKEREESGKL
ncbi:hypothetical protein BC829DRAFT_403821 [Chytridium lagenaria]|nr:hypothetical protein BC829DRAFT_403821 [Chytridium lagenaria]